MELTYTGSYKRASITKDDIMFVTYILINELRNASDALLGYSC